VLLLEEKKRKTSFVLSIKDSWSWNSKYEKLIKYCDNIKNSLEIKSRTCHSNVSS